jgi:hypothetical protein
MTTQQQQLEHLGQRLERQGLGFRSAPFFAEAGILLFTAQDATAEDRQRVIERGVFLYPMAGGWQARLAPHGGPDWTFDAVTLDALEEAALAALRTSSIPPSLEWRCEQIHGTSE